MLRLLIFAFIAFWVFSKFFGPQAGGDRTAAPEAEPRRQNLPRYDIEPAPRDWKLEEVETARELPKTGPRRSATPRDDSSDWSIEEVEVKTGPRRGDTEVRFDPRGIEQGKAKKTIEGDWSIEEVETD